MLIQTIRDCLRFCDVNLPRYGIRALDFLKLREERGSFPSYMVETRENGVLSTSYAWSKAEAEQQVAAANERKNAASVEAPENENAEEAEAEEAPVTDDVAKEAAAQYDEDGNLISNAEPQAIRVALALGTSFPQQELDLSHLRAHKQLYPYQEYSTLLDSLAIP